MYYTTKKFIGMMLWGAIAGNIEHGRKINATGFFPHMRAKSI